MNEGISADEACRMHVLTDEDFSRMCNEGGTLRSQPKTTTFTLKNDSSKSLTVNNSIMQVSLVAVLATALAISYVLLKRLFARKSPTKNLRNTGEGFKKYWVLVTGLLVAILLSIALSLVLFTKKSCDGIACATGDNCVAPNDAIVKCEALRANPTKTDWP